MYYGILKSCGCMITIDMYLNQHLCYCVLEKMVAMSDVMLTYSFSCEQESKERKRMIYGTGRSARLSFQSGHRSGFPRGML